MFFILWKIFFQNVENSINRILKAVLQCNEDKTSSLLEWDAFSTLVSLTLGLPSFYNKRVGVARGTIQVSNCLIHCFNIFNYLIYY